MKLGVLVLTLSIVLSSFAQDSNEAVNADACVEGWSLPQILGEALNLRDALDDVRQLMRCIDIDQREEQQLAQGLRIRLTAEGMAVDICARANLAKDEAQAALHRGAAGAIGMQQGAVDIEEDEGRSMIGRPVGGRRWAGHQREPGRVTGAVGAAGGFDFDRIARVSLMTT